MTRHHGVIARGEDGRSPGLARGLLPGLADWCSIYVLEGDRLREVTTAQTDPATAEAILDAVEAVKAA